MKFWFDVITPKQVNFFKPLVDVLKIRKHHVMCTSRNYREVVELAKIKGLDLIIVGEYGGNSLYGKLKASIDRSERLIDTIQSFSPDALVSLCSPEASRVAFGLGVRHVGFCDAPHAEAVCKLSIPLMNSLMCPSIIPSNEFTRYGIDAKKLIRYRGLDPAMWLRNSRDMYTHDDLGLDESKQTITFRFEESQAAYLQGIDNSLSQNMLKRLISSFPTTNIVVLSRYPEQIGTLKREFGGKTIIIESVIDGTSLLRLSDVFIGSGGTMNWECALLGIPSISYTPMKYHVNEYLVKKGLIVKCRDIELLLKLVSKMLTDKEYRKALRVKSKNELSRMEDIKKPTVRILETPQ